MNQLQILRKMSGEERVEQAIQLSELTRELVIANIKEHLGKSATKKQIMAKLRERFNETRKIQSASWRSRIFR